MIAKRIYSLLAILIGYGLIIAGFIVFGESLEKNILILDIIMSCLIFTLLAQVTFFPLVNLSNKVNKEVGMLGINLVILPTFCVLSLGLMICGMIYEMPFKFQLMGQLVIVFILLVGRIAAIHSGDKVQNIYSKEQTKKEGKVSLRMTMVDFCDYISSVQQLDPAIVDKLNSIQESIRFITPCDTTEARMMDNQFIQSVEDLKVLMKNTTLNKEKIADEVAHLERILARRKNIYNNP